MLTKAWGQGCFNNTWGEERNNGKVTKFSESTSNSRFIYFTIRDWPELAAAVTFSKREGQAGQGLSPHPRNVSVKYLVH